MVGFYNHLSNLEGIFNIFQKIWNFSKASRVQINSRRPQNMIGIMFETVVTVIWVFRL